MTTANNNLLDFLDCEALDVNLYRGKSKDFSYGQVFGGQVLGQAIKAAYSTVDNERFIHSAHAYFLRRGDVAAPIIYEIDRSLDGASFSSRRVVAIQHGKQIFHLSASFQKPEQGLEYSEKCHPPVDLLKDNAEQLCGAQNKGEFHADQSDFLDFRFLSVAERTNPNNIQLWFKSKHKLPDALPCHHSVLAYISDMGLLQASLMPHSPSGSPMRDYQKNLIMASLDHAIWFHRPFRADEWLFYDCASQSTSNARGLTQGRISTADGELIATTMQEGLIRLRD